MRNKTKPGKSKLVGLLEGSSWNSGWDPWWFIVESELTIWFFRQYHCVVNSVHNVGTAPKQYCRGQIVKKAHECCFHLCLIVFSSELWDSTLNRQNQPALHRHNKWGVGFLSLTPLPTLFPYLDLYNEFSSRPSLICFLVLGRITKIHH